MKLKTIEMTVNEDEKVFRILETRFGMTAEQIAETVFRHGLHDYQRILQDVRE